MKILFCNIAWMKHYQGVTDEDQPFNGGSYVNRNNDGGEIYNFLHFNHKYYGFVMTGGSIHIERFDNTSHKQAFVQGVLVVWTASKPKTKGVYIVGWYKNATIYREQQSCTTELDEEYFYNMCCDVKDGMLLAEHDRTFEIPLASNAGKGMGKGQSNVWFAEDPLAQKEIIPRVLAYIDGWSKPSASRIYSAEELKQLYTASQGKSIEDMAAIANKMTNLYDQLLVHNSVCVAYPIAENFVQRTNHLWNMGYCQEALLDLETALRLENDNLFVIANLATRQMILGQNQEALVGFKTVLAGLENDPGVTRYWPDEADIDQLKAEILWLTSTIHIRMGEKNQAAETLRKYITFETDIENINSAKELLDEIGFGVKE